MNAKADETVVHEWIDFPELKNNGEEKTLKEDKHTTLHVGMTFDFKNPNPNFYFRLVEKFFSVDMMLIKI